MIGFQKLARVRRELESILLLINEFDDKGISIGDTVNNILNEPEKPITTNEGSGKDREDGKGGS